MDCGRGAIFLSSNFTGWPAPSARIHQSAGAPLRPVPDEYTRCLPSGAHAISRFPGAVKVSWVDVLLMMSYTQTSVPFPTVTWYARRLPSGENRGAS